MKIQLWQGNRLRHFIPRAACAVSRRSWLFQEEAMTAYVDNVAKEIAADFAVLRRDIAHLTEALRGLVDAQTQTAGARVSEAADGVKDRLAQAAGDARKGAEVAGDQVAASIGRNPITAILIALGLGLLVGLFGRSRG
jgi:ElaB/YqjD/DUF883 family membrane-anchored ribosome-binding protein